MGVATAVAVAGVAVSAYGAHSANKSGKKAKNSQEQMHMDQMALAEQQRQFGEQHYNWSMGLHDEYKERFDPVLGEMTNEAMANREPDYGMITADTMSAFDSARGAEQRNLARYGIGPSDGQWGATERRYGIGQAEAEVGTRQMARRAADEDRYNRLAQLYGVGAGLQGQAMGGMQAGMGIMQGGAGMGINAQGQAAGMYGNQANTYGQLASSNMAGFVNNLGGVVDTYMQNRQPGVQKSPGGPYANQPKRPGSP